jgi:hypothetical protein
VQMICWEGGLTPSQLHWGNLSFVDALLLAGRFGKQEMMLALIENSQTIHPVLSTGPGYFAEKPRRRKTWRWCGFAEASGEWSVLKGIWMGSCNAQNCELKLFCLGLVLIWKLSYNNVVGWWCCGAWVSSVWGWVLPCVIAGKPGETFLKMVGLRA